MDRSLTITHDPMQLHDYPEAIATLQRSLLAQTQQIRELKTALGEMDAGIKYSVAFDTDLKNDRQREACIAELKSAAGYQALMGELQAAQDKQADLEIELEFVRNQFTLAKLEVRERIAQIEMQARSLE